MLVLALFHQMRAKCGQLFRHAEATTSHVMATIKIHLDTRNLTKNGLFPIVLKVSHNRDHRNIPTGLRAKKSEFVENGGLFRNNPEGNTKILELLLCEAFLFTYFTGKIQQKTYIC